LDNQTAHISLQINYQCQKAEEQNHQRSANQSTPAPDNPNQNFTPVSRASQHRLPGPSSVPAFGEAVFRQTEPETQAGFPRKTTQNTKTNATR
ncbi:hypothetical protein, partial [Paracoccus indicus]|uniref:hypothetical protein n=1 Tax=Paracoccus indicus TaxID=2079229 RepID=UPI0013B3C40F